MSTEKDLRNKIIKTASSYIGAKGGSAAHSEILHFFNTVKPQGYTAKRSDYWCAEFASACAIQAFGKEIAKKYFPLSASCPVIISLAKDMGIWVENDAYKPNKGDWILYDWEDNGKGDNRGTPNHVGIVKTVSNGKITVIEGNYSNSVKTRTINVNGAYIRGFVTPKYSAFADKEKKEKPVKKSVDEIAKEVINGKWGNGEDRKTRLKNAGYDYDAVQARVNELIAKPAKYEVVATAGMNVRKAPTTNAAIVGWLKLGQVFTSTKQSNGWVYCDARKGWVKSGKDYIKQV